MNASLDFWPGHTRQDKAAVFFSPASELRVGRCS